MEVVHIHLQQGSDFRASFGIDVGTLFDIEQDDGVSPGDRNNAANARDGFRVSNGLVLRLYS